MAIMKKMKKRFNRNKRRAMVGAVKSAYKGGSGKATVGTALAAKGTLKKGSRLDKVVRKAGKTVRKAKAAKAKFKKTYAKGKTLGKRVAASGEKKFGTKMAGRRASRGISNEFRKMNDGFGGRRKGNIAGKAGMLAGTIKGAASFKMTSARKAALKKAQQASARLRKGKKRLFGK